MNTQTETCGVCGLLLPAGVRCCSENCKQKRIAQMRARHRAEAGLPAIRAKRAPQSAKVRAVLKALNDFVQEELG